MHTSEYDFLFKLLLIGDSGVGKVSPVPSRNSSPCDEFVLFAVLPASAFRRRYIHRELYQYYWC